MVTINPHVVNAVRCDVYTMKGQRSRSDLALAIIRSARKGKFELDLSGVEFTDQRAAKLFSMWIKLGCPEQTAVAAVIIAYNESRFDGAALNPSSGAKGLYQALSPRFKKVASRSKRLEDHLPMMKEMFTAYKMSDEISLQSLYAMHFQGRYAKKSTDDLRGFVNADGSTLGGQYAVTDGRSSWTDLSYLAISSLINSFEVLRLPSPLTVSCPISVHDLRVKKRYSAMTSIARYTGSEHVQLDSGVSAQSIALDGSPNFFISDPSLMVDYHAKHALTSYPISVSWTSEPDAGNQPN